MNLYKNESTSITYIMSSVFVIFYIDEMTIRGVYSSLEIAKSNAESYFKPNDIWCIQEQILDDKPCSKFNNVYQNKDNM